MTVVTAVSPYYDLAVRDFKAAGVPDELLAQITPAPAKVARADAPGWYTTPPRPGCTAPSSLGAAAVYGAFDLRQWWDLAPNAWGPDMTADVIDRAQTAAETLRIAGEGSRVLWSLYALRPGEWRTYERTAISIEYLVQCGPKLTEKQLGDVRSVLDPAWSWDDHNGVVDRPSPGWRRQDQWWRDHPLHTEYELHGATVYSTSWSWEP